MPQRPSLPVLARAGALLLPLLAALAPASAAERYEGLAYAPGSDRLLYRETHYLYRQGAQQRRLVLYGCPTGDDAFARKQVDYAPGAAAPDFDFVDARDGYREGVGSGDGQRHAWVQSTPASTRTRRALPRAAGGVIDAGFDAWIGAHWQALQAGAEVTVPFLVPSRFQWLDFRIARGKDAVFSGQPARRLRMSLDAWYGFAAPDITLLYARDRHQLLQFEGPGTIRDARGKPQPVRIEFPDATRDPSVGEEAVRRAARRPLVQACPA